MGGPCDYSVTPVPLELVFGFRTALGLGLGLENAVINQTSKRY